MRFAARATAIFMCAAACAGVSFGQAVRYVWTNSPSPDGQYLTWATAARDIQAAVDVAAPGDVILVTNGVYDRGGVRNWPPGATLTNRVAIYKPVAVRSVNGPSNTFIVGRWHVPGNTNYIFGSNAVRCVYMTNGAVLSGFTLTNGSTLSDLSSNESAFSCRGGGVYCQSTNMIITNCLIIDNRARWSGGGVNGGAVYNCTVMGNSLFVPPPSTWVEHGGGVAGGIVYNSLLTKNYSPYAGAGAQGCRLYNCVVLDNTCAGRGGGVDMSIVFDSLIVSNKGNGGGGAYFGWGLGLIYNSTLIGNSSGNNGGAVAVGDWTWGWQEGGPAIFNSLIVGNLAAQNGGGVYGGGYLYNCTVTGNSNGQWGYGSGGVMHTTNWNTIVYNNVMAYNDSTNQYRNHTNSVFYYSCTVPLPPGPGNVAADPKFKDSGLGYGLSHVPGDSRLANGSPCVNAGTNFSWQTLDPLGRGRDKDLDGGPRIYLGTVDMGAYERIPPGTIFMLKGQ